MGESTRRFVFHPRERRGLLLGLEGGQIAVMLGGGVVALVAGRSLTGPAAPALALIILVVSATAAVWPRAGRPLANWVPIASAWGLRRAVGPSLDRRPLDGGLASRGRWRGADVSADERSRNGRSMRAARRRRCSPGPEGVELYTAHSEPGQDALGVIYDHRSGRTAAILPVRGSTFVLLGADEQTRRLEGWRSVLGTVARAGTPVCRLQWVQRSSGCRAAGDAPGPLPSMDRAVASYRELLGGEGATGRSYEAWVVVAVPASPHGPRRLADVDVLRREVRFLQGQLRNADLHAGRPLDRDALAELLAASYADEGRARTPWAMASDEAWATVRLDGSWHATYWIAEWPRLEVGPDFLTPMLMGPDRRTVSLVMAPVAPDRAVRQVRAARAADVADEELRSRAGFLPSARRGREAEGVLAREHELADGHAEYRFSGYVTVSAADRAGLALSCAQVEQSAQESHLELRRLYGRQAEAFTWTLPLARGLA